MTRGVTFDDFDNGDAYEVRDTKPIWSIDLKDKGRLLEWLNNDWENKSETSKNRLRGYMENLALYKGLHYHNQQGRSEAFRNQESVVPQRNPKIAINHAHDLLEAKVSDLNQFKVAISVIPQTTEWKDKINSRTIKKLIDTRWHQVDIDKKISDIDRVRMIYGDAFLLVDWNRDLGPIHQKAGKLAKAGIQIPKLDEEGSTIPGEFIEVVPRIGDVDYQLWLPSQVFLERKDCWDKVNDFTLVEFLPLAEVRQEYSELSNKIQADTGSFEDPAEMEDSPGHDEVLVKRYYRRPDKYLPQGLFVKYTKDTLLEVSEWPYKNKKGEPILDLPLIKVSDDEVPGEVYGRSRLRRIRQLQIYYNNLFSVAVKMHGIAGMLKWLVHHGANVNLNSLGNEVSVVKWQGSVEPKLQKFDVISADIPIFMDRAERLMEKFMGVFQISRGEKPKGIDTGVGLNFFDEQEEKRASTDIAKRKRLTIDIARQTTLRMEQNYREDDGRILGVVGHDNSYAVEAFKEAVFETPYDITLQNSSALPQQKSARMQAIVSLNQGFPGLISNEQVLSMLELGNEQEFYDLATVSIKAAESENDDMMKGEAPQEPQEWEELIIHWLSHVKMLQERTFKEKAPSDVQRLAIEHITTTEMLMWNRAQKNQVFAQKLATLDSFPLFFELPPAPVPVPAPQAQPEPTASAKSKDIQLPEIQMNQQ